MTTKIIDSPIGQYTVSDEPPPVAASPQSELVEGLSQLLDRTAEWTSGSHTLDHPSGVQLWICSGRQFLELYQPANFRFTEEEKDILWPKIDAILGGYEMWKHAWNKARVDKVLGAIASYQPD